MGAVHDFQLILLLLTVALVLPILCRRLPLPGPATLVLGGMVLALLPDMPTVEIDSELAMQLFLPPLLLSSAVATVWRDFRAELRSIVLLAIGAVTFTTLLVGCAAHWLVPSLPWGACFALGAIISPPDAVSAKALLQGLPLPRRTVTILEGESLVNDASGLVLYRFAIAAVLTHTFQWRTALLEFCWVSVGGILVGLAAGWLSTWLLRHLKAHEGVVLSFLTAWVTYIFTDYLGLSGVLAVVVCGLVLGWRQHLILSAGDRRQISAVWNVVVTVFETLVFVLIGLAVHAVLRRFGGFQPALQQAGVLATAVVLTAIVARMLWMLTGHLAAMLTGTRRLDGASVAIISWAGMRGGVSLAAALALPRGFPGRDLFIFVTFVVIAFTVLVQGSTLGPLIRMLQRRGLAIEDRPQQGELAARKRISTAGLNHLESLRAAGADQPFEHQRLLDMYNSRLGFMGRMGSTVEVTSQQRQSYFGAALGAINASRQELIRMHRDGSLPEPLVRTLEAELDLEEIRLNMLQGTRW